MNWIWDNISNFSNIIVLIFPLKRRLILNNDSQDAMISNYHPLTSSLVLLLWNRFHKVRFVSYILGENLNKHKMLNVHICKRKLCEKKKIAHSRLFAPENLLLRTKLTETLNFFISLMDNSKYLSSYEENLLCELVVFALFQIIVSLSLFYVCCPEVVCSTWFENNHLSLNIL